MTNLIRNAADAPILRAVDLWSEPLPLIAPEDAAAEYPIQAIPPLIRNAVTAYQSYGQQPMALVASSALAAVSLASQGLADVARDENLRSPISLNILVVAESGERKSSADRHFTRAIREWQANRQKSLGGEQAVNRAVLDTYQAERDGMLAKIKSAAGKGGAEDEADHKALLERLGDLEKNRPAELILPNLFNEDTNAEKLAVGLGTGWPSSSVWSDEAGLFVGSNGMKDESAVRFLALLNRLWDGREFKRDRVTAQSVIVRGRRLTCCLMMQAVVLAKLLDAGGKGMARGIGTISRYLIAAPASAMGTRFYKSANLSDSACADLDYRIAELLNMPLPTTGEDLVLDPPVLRFSAPAFNKWREAHDAIESELRADGEFRSVADVAGKSADNISRLAANFHVLQQGPAGDISANEIEAATAVVGWHLKEGRRLLNAVGIPAEVIAATNLLTWLRRQPDGVSARTDVLQRGPETTRKAKALDDALARLIEAHCARKETVSDKLFYRVNPRLMGAAQ